MADVARASKLNDLTVEQWVEEFERLKKRNQEIRASAKSRLTRSK